MQGMLVELYVKPELRQLGMKRSLEFELEDMKKRDETCTVECLFG